jgi:hypothetical protein
MKCGFLSKIVGPHTNANEGTPVINDLHFSVDRFDNNGSEEANISEETEWFDGTPTFRFPT